MIKRVALAVAAVFVAVLTAYMVLVADVLSPRSHLNGYFALTTNNQFDLSQLDEWKRAARQKYGPDVQTPVRMINGGSQWEARLDNTTLEVRPLGRKPGTTYGVFAVNDADGTKIPFPFMLRLGDGSQPREQTLTAQIRYGLERVVPAAILAFGDDDWRLGVCHRPDKSFNRSISEALFHPQSRDVCMIERTDGRGPMLIGTAVVDSSWVRPFGRTTCRGLAAGWLDAMRQAEPDETPKYAGCVLVTPGADSGAPIVVSAQFFEIRGDQSLAIFRNTIW